VTQWKNLQKSPRMPLRASRVAILQCPSCQDQPAQKNGCDSHASSRKPRTRRLRFRRRQHCVLPGQYGRKGPGLKSYRGRTHGESLKQRQHTSLKNFKGKRRNAPLDVFPSCGDWYSGRVSLFSAVDWAVKHPQQTAISLAPSLHRHQSLCL
jgi:hypothetical protein